LNQVMKVPQFLTLKANGGMKSLNLTDQ